MGKLVEWLLKHERQAIIGSLIIIAVLAWIYLGVMYVQMNWMMTQVMSEVLPIHHWTITEAVLTLIMWTVMMMGMMIPGAAPTILLYARVCQKYRLNQSPLVPTGAFLLGYMTVWTVFSFIATFLQWGLAQATLLSPMIVSTSSLLSGVILVLAGLYQYTPYKYNCLKHCRSPVEFLSMRWRNGSLGAYKMGIEHGIYCLGCCWALMVLLFVGGVMNLLWIAALAIFILLEKILRWGRLIGQISAIGLVVWGTLLMTMY